jgi:hypothetical protein
MDSPPLFLFLYTDNTSFIHTYLDILKLSFLGLS